LDHDVKQDSQLPATEDDASPAFADHRMTTPPQSPSKGGYLTRLFIFLALAFGIAPAIVGTLIRILQPSFSTVDPVTLLWLDAGNFAFILALSAAMAVFERRRVGDYGLPLHEMFQRKFCLGIVFGLAEASLLIGLIAAVGGYSFGPLALSGTEVLRWGFLHLVLFLFVGLYEEFLFRGYLQFALSQLIGFWPAAALLSVGFGFVHLANQGEDWVGALSVAIVGLFFAFTLKRTGNLWYAVGLHMSFDWAESFLYSAPDSGEVLRGHLSYALLHGPKWLTGGSVGPEGSVFCFLTMGLQFLVVMWLFPKKSATSPSQLASPATQT
jgi:uncharacterized protein